MDASDRRGAAPVPGVRHPLMRMRWENLCFLHWPYPVDAVGRLLPPGFGVEQWDGLAWVGLVALYMRVRPPVGPAIPGLTTFPETNVRTYVTGPTGDPGVWFLSMDAANPPAVLLGRAAFGLPYVFSRMRFTRDGDRLAYFSRRAGAHGGRASHRIEVEARDTVPTAGVDDFDDFLTARFRMWSVNRGAVLLSEQEHPPWSFRRATVTVLEQDLLEHAALPTPSGEPVVHFSDGMDVRVGRPRVVSRRRPA